GERGGRQGGGGGEPVAGRAEGAAGVDSRWVHLGTRRDRRRTDRRRRREARRSVLGTAGRRGDRELVCVRRGARLPVVPSARPVWGKNHRAGMKIPLTVRRGGGRLTGRDAVRPHSTSQIDITLRLSRCTGPLLIPALLGIESLLIHHTPISESSR